VVKEVVKPLLKEVEVLKALNPQRSTRQVIRNLHLLLFFFITLKTRVE